MPHKYLISLLLCLTPQVHSAFAANLIKETEVPDTVISTNLPEVTVKAELIVRQAMEDVITITPQMRKEAHNVAELLGKLPGLHHNPLSGDISFLGGKNIILLVDSIEKDQSYIKRMGPDRFNRVNIITSPHGKYEGYDAIISLHTIPVYSGYEGLLIGEIKSATSGRNGKNNNLRDSRAVGLFSYIHKNINVDFIASWDWNRVGLSDYFSTERPLNEFKEGTIETSLRSPNKKKRNSHTYADFSLDYDFNSNHSISVKIKAAPSWSHDEYNYMVVRDFYKYDLTDTVVQKIRISDDQRWDILTGLWYRGKFRNWDLRADATYNITNYQHLYNIHRNSGLNIQDNREIKTYYVTGSAEASTITKNRKWAFSIYDNFVYANYKAFRLHTSLTISESEDYRNTIYASTRYYPNKLFSLGINAGFSIMNSKNSGDKATHMTPKLGIQAAWHPSKAFAMRFLYKVSSRYPALSRMQNYGLFTDSLEWQEGNPHLKPMLRHELSLNLTLLDFLTISGKYNYNYNATLDYMTAKFGEISSGEETYYNCLSQVNGISELWTANATFAKSLGKHWQVSATATIKGYRAKYKDDSSHKILPEYDWYMMYQFHQGTTQIYLSGNMENNVVISPQTCLYNHEDHMALAIIKTFNNNQFQLIGMWMLPIHFVDGHWHGHTQSESKITRYWASNQSRSDNLISLSVVYRFGKGKNVKKYNKTSQSVEL